MTYPVRTALAAAAFLAPSAARAATVPVFDNGGGVATHSPGSPAGSAYQYDGLGIPAGTAKADPSFNKHKIDFYGGGNTVATVGLAHNQGSNLAKITFAAGTGISQTDPLHSQSESRLDVQFTASWAITSGTFGPPINTSFSIPIGVKVGANGYAAFAADVHWSATYYGSPVADARAPYVVPATTFGPGTKLTSFTAPAAPFTFTSLDAAPATYIRMYGTLTFTANNDDGPVLIEIPTAENFGDQPDFARYDYEAGAAVGAVVPEPAAVGTIGLAAAAGLLGRRCRVTRR